MVFTFIAISAQLIWAQQSKEVAITEPAVIDVASLFNQADTVALVKIVSGDAENYNHAIYKGEVIKSFKGTPSSNSPHPHLMQRRHALISVQFRSTVSSLIRAGRH